MSERQEVWAVSPRGEGKKDWWTRAGTAFQNRDGSWTLMLDVLPTNGKLIMREEKEREARDEPPVRRDETAQQSRRPAAQRGAPPPAPPPAPVSNDYGDAYEGADDPLPF